MVNLNDPILYSRIENMLEREITTLYWTGTIFEKYELTGSTVIKGAIGEEICRHIFETKGIKVDYRENKEHDIIVNGKKIEIKTSLSGEPKNYFSATFCHINLSLDWDILLLLTAKPDKVFCRYYRKEEVERMLIKGLLKKEHYSSSKYPGDYYAARIGLRNQHKYMEYGSESFELI